MSNDDGDSKQVNLFLLNGKGEIVAEAIINKRYKIEKNTSSQLKSKKHTS